MFTRIRNQEFILFNGSPCSFILYFIFLRVQSKKIFILPFYHVFLLSKLVLIDVNLQIISVFCYLFRRSTLIRFLSVTDGFYFINLFFLYIFQIIRIIIWWLTIFVFLGFYLKLLVSLFSLTCYFPIFTHHLSLISHNLSLFTHHLSLISNFLSLPTLQIEEQSRSYFLLIFMEVFDLFPFHRTRWFR